MPQNNDEERIMSALVWLKMKPELKDLAGKKADKLGLPLSEFIVQILANDLKRPDLGTIPRKRIGRPRKPVRG